MWHWGRRFSRLGILLATLAFGPRLPAAAVSIDSAILEETIREAAAIFIGRVAEQETRWGSDARRWLVTETRFDVEEVLLPGPDVRAGEALSLAFWGGTLEGETQEIAGVTRPGLGQRYVMLLRPGWTRPGFTPVVGLDQGMLRVEETAAGTDRVIDLSAPVPLPAFVGWLRANLTRIRSAPRTPAPSADPDDPRRMRTFALLPEPEGIRPGTESVVGVPPALPAVNGDHGPFPQPPARPVYYPVDAVPVAGSDPALAGHGAPGAGIRPQYYSTAKASLPIILNPLAPSSTVGDAPSAWTPEDQYQAAKWNHYANIFQVRAAPTGRYGWGNGSFDLAGWVSNPDLQVVYGAPWPANTNALTFRRKSNTGIILEADIAFSPLGAWTLDDEWVYDGGSAVSFRNTLMRELGAMLGLDRQIGYLSLMNRPQPTYRAFTFPFMDDAEGVRSLYPSQAQARTDLGVYLFRSVGPENWAEPAFPSRVTVGGSILISDYHVENVGTTTIARPAVEWYLTTARNYDQPTYYLGTTLYPPLNRFQHFLSNTVSRSLVVPSTVPPGDYYLSAFIPNQPGAGQASFPFINNLAWTRSKIRVIAR